MNHENSAKGEDRLIPNGRTPNGLRWSLAAGVTAFTLDLGVSYVLRQHVCTSSQILELHLVTFVCAALGLSGFVVGWLGYNNLPHDSEEEGGEPHDRAHFEALLGMGLSLAFTLVIIAIGVPRLLLNACE